MRKLYKKIITREESDSLLSFQGTCSYNSDPILEFKRQDPVGALTFSWIIDRILDKIKDDFSCNEISEYSYCFLCSSKEGHELHQDVEFPISTSLLLEEPESGGDIYYTDDKHGTNEMNIDRDVYDLAVHTTDEWHGVKPSTVGRKVFLLFI